MKERVHRYEGDQLTVTYEPALCIHAAECLRSLPAVFDTRRTPWVEPNAATAEEVKAAVARCPSGALQWSTGEATSGACEATAEPAAIPNTVQVLANGPFVASGRIEIANPEGETLSTHTKVSLCRCGASSTKPLCDGSHRAAGFAEPGTAAQPAVLEEVEAAGELRIVLANGGPLLLRGAVEIHDAAGAVCYRGAKKSLCRCGASANKPYCDGAHNRIGFLSA